MRTRRGFQRSFFGLVCALAAGLALAAPAGAVDFSGLKEQEIPLFYPGQASWEWVLTPSDHSGAPKFRGGKNCTGCHAGEEADIGARIAGGKKLEPAPIPNKPGSIKLKVRSFHDAERLYLRLEWQGAQKPGGQKMNSHFAERVTVMLDDGSVKEATRAGCWGSCHDDAIGMPSAPPGKEIAKYLLASRTKVTRQGGDENFKSDGEIAQLLQQGIFLEYWQARLNPNQPAQPLDGYILKDRHENPQPLVQVESQKPSGAGNHWVVTLSRALKGAGPGHKDIVPGKTYMIGFAIHDDYAAHRFHFVSFGHSLRLDSGEADVVVVKK